MGWGGKDYRVIFLQRRGRGVKSAYFLEEDAKDVAFHVDFALFSPSCPLPPHSIMKDFEIMPGALTSNQIHVWSALMLYW